MATGTPRHTWTDNTTAITAAKLNALEQDIADGLATANVAEGGLAAKSAVTVDGSYTATLAVDTTAVTPADIGAAAENDARFTQVTANMQAASYTLVLADAGKVVEMNVGTANTLTIPPNSSVAFPVGTVVEVHQYGAGQTTVTAGSGVTLRAPDGAKTAKQYASASLRKRGTNEWIIAGSTAA